MHWHKYNNTVPLLNIVKSQIFHLVYNLKIFLNLALSCLPASQLAVRPDSTSAMVPNFSHKKGDCV